MTEHVCLTGIDGAWGCTSLCPFTHRGIPLPRTERSRPKHRRGRHERELLDLINDNWNGGS